ERKAPWRQPHCTRRYAPVGERSHIAHHHQPESKPATWATCSHQTLTGRIHANTAWSTPQRTDPIDSAGAYTYRAAIWHALFNRCSWTEGPPQRMKMGAERSIVREDGPETRRSGEPGAVSPLNRLP